MFQINGSDVWCECFDGFIDVIICVFFFDNIVYEVVCEEYMFCMMDMFSFKGYVVCWMVIVIQVVFFFVLKVLFVLQNLVKVVIVSCVGEKNGQRVCGFKWFMGIFDGSQGVGQMMNVLGVVLLLLIGQSRFFVINLMGGMSKGDLNVGSQSDNFKDKYLLLMMGDKVGVGILMVLILVSVVGMFGWMSIGV